MDFPWETVLIFVGVTFAVRAFFSMLGSRSHQGRYTDNMPELPAEFVLSKRILAFYWILLIASIGTALWGLWWNDRLSIFIYFIAALFGGIALLGIIFDGRKKVIIDSDTITYKGDWLFGFQLALERIKDVRVGSGCIVIDKGEKKRNVIPLIIGNAGTILMLLDNRRTLKAQQVRSLNSEQAPPALH